MFEHVIQKNVPSMSVKQYLRRAWPLLPQSASRTLLKRRDIKRDGVRLGPDDTVKGGDKLVVFMDENLFFSAPDVLFDDGRLVVLVKPQGLPVDEDRQGVGVDTLLTRLKRLHPEAELLHRLDAMTGGVLLAANDPETLEQGLAAFREHAFSKTYRAVVLGEFKEKSGEYRDFLIKDAHNSTVRIVKSDRPGAKPVHTRYRVLKQAAGRALVELEPVTGRTHQLRCHMAFYGHPILGDDHYGNREENKRAGGKLRLWCRKMEITDGPLARYKGLSFEAPEPNWEDLP